jgi:arylformamidase
MPSALHPAPTKVIDLSFPVRDHFRWKRRTDLVQRFAAGDLFDTTSVTMLCHSFTHADAPSHFTEGGAPLGDLALSTWVGAAAVIDVSDVGPGGRIDAGSLAGRGGHVTEGSIALIRTLWDTKVPVTSAEYWTTAPAMTRDAAEWLLARGLRCVGFDFPQDPGIRAVVRGEAAERGDFPTHDVLLANGVGLVEYLTNLDQVRGDWTFLVAAPIHLPDTDGAPVRALALEFDTKED